MAPGRNLTVYLTSDVSKFGRGLRQAESRMQKFGKVAKASLAGGALAAGYAAGQAIVSGVQAAIEEESSKATLARAMKNSINATTAEVDAMEAYVDAAQRRAAVDDGEVRSGLGRLIRSTKSATRAQALMNTAMEISAATGKPLGSVVEALAKFNDGNAGALKRLGITMGESTRNYAEYVAAVKNLQKAEGEANAARATYGPNSKEYAKSQEKVATAAEKVARIKGQGGIKWLSELNDQFKGSVASRMKTTAGGMAAVATAWSELTESMGVGIVGSDDRASGEMQQLADAMYDAQPSAEAVGTVIHDLALSLADVATYLGPIVEKFEALNNLSDGFLTNGSIVTVMKAINGDFTGPVVTGTGVAGDLTGPEARRLAAAQANAANGYYTDPRLDSFSSSSLYRYNTRSRDASGRGDARAAQRDARTRTRP